MSIRDNWKRFQDDLADTAASYGRDPAEIDVMAVSKTRNVDEIREAQAAGLSKFGENRVDEAASKFAELNSADYPLYLIGHLQSNKVQKIDARFTGVHSVDSLRLAGKLSTFRESLKLPLEVLIQVNTSGEASKTGLRSESDLRDLIEAVRLMPYLKVRGLMTMAPFVDDEKVVRECFSVCRTWLESVANRIDGTPILSMGMSSDYKWAVAEGANLLRIGTTIFGGRY